MNRLREKLIEAVRLQKDTFNIKSPSDAELYARGFLNGVRMQQKYNFLPYSDVEALSLLQEARKEALKSFFFTFGSNEKYPYPNGCVLIHAEDITKASDEFNKRFPNPDSTSILNCAFCYRQRDWERMEKKPPISEEIYVL